MLDRIATVTWRRPKAVLLAVAVFAVVAGVFGYGVEGHLKAAGFTDAASESERATLLLRQTLGYDANPGIVVVIRAKDGRPLDVRDPATRGEINRIATQLRATRFVGRVTNPLDGRPESAPLIERGGGSVLLAGYLASRDAEDDGGKAAAEAATRTTSDRLSVTIGGFAPAFNDVNHQTRADLEKAELIAFPLLALLLLIVFRGVVAAAIPLIIGGISIVGTLLLLRLMASVTDLSLFALNITTALSLGLAVDYALLLVTRYREEVARVGATHEAHRRTVATAGRTVLFSGITVAAAMVPLTLFPQRFLYSLGAAGAAVALLTSVMAVLIVPAMLAALGDRVNALSIRRGPSLSDDSGGWYRLARSVMRHPVRFAVGSMALLLLLAAPALSLALTGPSAKAVPPGQPSYEPDEYATQHYARSVIEAITVTVHGPASDAQLAAFSGRLARASRPGGAAAPVPLVRVSPTVAFANVAPPGPALDEVSRDAVQAIRAIPPPVGTTVLVSGNTARFLDQEASLAAHAPVVMAIICLTTLILLFLLTGSILLPIKTLLMNALTLAATFGVLVLSFQRGWLETPLHYIGPAAIELTSLAFLAAVIFGLATDYAVLVMARIKEQHDLGASNEDAVAIGIGRTGRVISAAALLIAVVFLAFAVSPVFFMKQIAIAMAVGVLLDATVVRALLVPSLMRLLGEWNWWAPGPLARFQARFGITEGEPEAPSGAGPGVAGAEDVVR